MDCSKTIDFFAELKRLCNSRTACEAVNASDEHCPMLDYCADSLVTQRTEEIAKAIESLQKWSDEHPKKTYAQDFFEKFPKAQSGSDGTPFACRKEIYGGARRTFENCDYTGTCKNCWNEPMEK
jgi:hypothetical protein